MNPYDIIFTSDKTNEVNEKIIKSTYIAKCLLSIQKFLISLSTKNRLESSSTAICPFELCHSI